MRLLRLALVFLGFALYAFASSDTPKKLDTPVVVPPHSPSQLIHRFDYARFGLEFMSNDYVEQALKGRAHKRIGRIDPNMLVAPNGDNTCYKMRKYLVQPKVQTFSNGVVPIGPATEPTAGDWQILGETNCTYANKVYPKRIEKLKPLQPNVGTQSTVFKPE